MNVRIRFYVALGAIACGVLMLQIAETRLISVTSWYHLAFFVISIAMFGLTAGAVYVHRFGRDITSDRVTPYLASASIASAAATFVALAFQSTIATNVSFSLMSVIVWLQFAIALSLPFFFSGIVVSLALTRSPYPIGTVYGADLVGAGLGCLGALALLNWTSGPTAIVWVAVLFALGGLLFGSTAPPASFAAIGWWATPWRYRHFILIGLAVLAAGNEYVPYGLRPLVVKEQVEDPSQFIVDKWNSFSRITMKRPETTEPTLWGASARLPKSQIEQSWLTIDGSTGTAMYKFDGDLRTIEFLRYDVSNLAYALPNLRSGAVIGVGGGRDVMSAKLFGLSEIVGVELNPIFVDQLQNGSSHFNRIASQPGVELIVDEARSWFARTSRTFDVIQMSLIDTWAATGAGAFTLSENGLYTVEAWRIFLKRLKPGGYFTVSRWYAAGEINETGRMISLAVSTLHALGVEKPDQHLFLAAQGNVATLIVSPSPLTADARAALMKTVETEQYKLLLAPNAAPASPLLGRIVAAKDGRALAEATGGFRLDLSPPTDGRPFFFNQLRLASVFDRALLLDPWKPGVFGGNLVATLTLVTLMFVSLLCVVTTIVLPLRAAARESGRLLTVAGTAFFALIGAGFMLIEIGLLQRLGIFLGHPVYALSIVLFSLIISTGVGSFASERLGLQSFARASLFALVTAAYTLLLPVWLPDRLIVLEGEGLLTRAAFCIAALFPAGFFLGMWFPTGMRMVSAIDPRPTPWFWGINGAVGVMASSVAVLTSISQGIDVTLAIGGVCYLLLLAPIYLLSRLSETAGRRAT